MFTIYYFTYVTDKTLSDFDCYTCIQLHSVNLIKVAMPQHGLIFKLDNDGRIVKTLHDVGGTVTSTASHVLDLGDQLIVGSYTAPYIVILSVY